MLTSLFANLLDYRNDPELINTVSFGRVETLKYHRHAATMRRVGVFGGTFDPVHYGHLVVAEEVYSTLQLAEMVFVPARQPPHKTHAVISAAEHRLAMLE